MSDYVISQLDGSAVKQHEIDGLGPDCASHFMGQLCLELRRGDRTFPVYQYADVVVATRADVPTGLRAEKISQHYVVLLGKPCT